MSARAERPIVALAAPSRLPYLIASLAVLALVVASAYGTIPLAPFPAFLPVAMTAGAVLYLVIAFHLCRLYVLTGRRRLAALGYTFAFTGLIILAYMAFFPDILPFFIGTAYAATSSTWLWTLWHFAFPLGIVLSLLVEDRERMGDPESERQRYLQFLTIFTLLPVFVAVFSFLLALLSPSLPLLISGIAYTDFARTYLLGPSLFFLLSTLIFVFWRTRGSTLLERWLVVSLLITLCDVIITIGALDRYNLGWYMARGLSLLGAGLLFFALFDDFASIYGRLAFSHEALRISARTDPLTQLANRAYSLQRTQDLLTANTPFCLALMDLDHFKRVNDTHGHLVGDEVLRTAAARAAHALKTKDLAGRYGGEEFVFLFVNLDLDRAHLVGERVLAALRSEPIVTRVGPLALSASMGLVASVSGEALNQLLARADAALYAAKHAGRDRLVVTA